MSEVKERRTVLEEVPNARLYSDGTILLKMVRLSYPHLFKPQENTDDNGNVTTSYSVTGLMPKKTHDEAKKLVVKEINRILKENNKGEKLPANRKFFKDGDPKDEDDVSNPESAGMWIVTARDRKKRPILLSNVKDPETGKAKRLKPGVPEDEDLLYGGCWVDILIRLWWQSNKYGKRVNAGVVAVQFRKHDEAFGGGRITDAELDDIFDEAEDAYEDSDGEDL